MKHKIIFFLDDTKITCSTKTPLFISHDIPYTVCHIHAEGLSQTICYTQDTESVPPRDLDVLRLAAQDVHSFFMIPSNTNMAEPDKVLLSGSCAWRQFVMEILSRCHVSWHEMQRGAERWAVRVAMPSNCEGHLPCSVYYAHIKLI